MLMIELLSQHRLLAQRGADDWMNIVFLVAVGAIWLIGGIVKAAAAGRKKRKEPSTPQKRARQESFLDRLVRKAEELQRAAELQGRQGGEQSRKPESRGPRPRPAEQAPAAPGRVSVRTGRGGQPVLVYERQAPPATAQKERPRPARPGRRPQREAQPAPAPKPLETPVVSPVIPEIALARPITPEPAVSASAERLLADYSDSDALRRAILHTEILGKPLALRDPYV